MKTVFIYALCEPGTRTVRYIGKTVNMTRRLSQHLWESIKQKNHLGCWLRSLAGASPNMVKLSEVPFELSISEEIRFIAAARTSLGMDLVNGTNGGEGVEQTPEVIAKLQATRRLPEHAVAISNKVKKWWESPEYREKQRLSRKAAWSLPGVKEKLLGRKRLGAASKFHGISWIKKIKKWRVRVLLPQDKPSNRSQKKFTHVGTFSNELLAALAFDAAVKRLEISTPLNFPNEH